MDPNTLAGKNSNNNNNNSSSSSSNSNPTDETWLLNDFDVHFFYMQNPRKPRLTRALKRIVTDVVSFDNIAVDFLRTVVPVRIKGPRPTGVMTLLRTFLEQAPTPNAKHLARKAVVGLFPREIYGKTIWPSPKVEGRRV